MGKWPCFYVPSKHHRKRVAKFAILMCAQEACRIHQRHHNTPNMRLLCCHHSNSRRYRHLTEHDIWNRFEAAHKHTGIYSLYLQQWLSMSTKQHKQSKSSSSSSFSSSASFSASSSHSSGEKKQEQEEEEGEHKRMSMESAMSLLELTHNDSLNAANIQKAYRKQALLYHPDKAGAKATDIAREAASDKMKAINEAREVLLRSDVLLRSMQTKQTEEKAKTE